MRSGGGREEMTSIFELEIADQVQICLMYQR